jgi:MFS family permease
VGGRTATITAIGFGVLSVLGSATVVPSWGWLLVWGAVGGVGTGIGHPASNHLMAVRVNPKRMATALGIKQGAVPFAALLAGLSVPLIALWFGWRWGFGVAAVLCAALLVAFLRLGPQRVARRDRRPHVPISAPLARYLLFVASVTTLGAGAAGAASSYAVTAGIERGIDDGWAGILLSAGSLLGAVFRILSGRLADRTGGRIALPLATVLLATGAIGTGLMAIDSPVTFAIGVLLALGPGWGWTGLTHFVVTRVAGPATPSATGIVQTGSYLGSGGGPLLFGLAYAHSHSSLDWLVVAGVQLLSTVIAIALSRRRPPAVPGAPAPAATPEAAEVG